MNRLMEARKSRGLTQVELAKKIGVSNKTIMRYEKGERMPTVDTAKKIAKALNVPMQEIF